MIQNKNQLHVVSSRFKDVELNLRGAGTIAVFRCNGEIIHHRLTDSEYTTYRYMVYRDRRSAMEFLLVTVLNGSRFDKSDFGIEGTFINCAEIEEFGKEVETLIKAKGGI